MINIAGPQDFDSCIKLLRLLGPVKHITHDYLYLNNITNGFTVLVKRNDAVIAMSTFTIRRENKKEGGTAVLYWENLVVDKFHRDGIAYVLILGYLRKLIKRREFDDIYFIVRRKKALKVHKAAKFLTFGYLSVIMKRITFGIKVAPKSKFRSLSYQDFIKNINSMGQIFGRNLREYEGFEFREKKEIQRRLIGKNGNVIIDEKNMRIYFLRSIIRHPLIEVNLFIPSIYTSNVPDLSDFSKALFNVTLGVKRHKEKLNMLDWLLPRVTYEGLSLNGKKSISKFEIWEHDAW